MQAVAHSISARVILKKDRDFPVVQGHPWIFSGALAGNPQILNQADLQDGAVVEVYSHADEFLGLGFYNSKTSISVRMISGSHGEVKDPQVIIESALSAAIAARNNWLPSNCTCRRLVNAEGDGLPGLIIDQYGEHLVLQISTAGMQLFKTQIIEKLKELTLATSIYERSDSASRDEEGLPALVGPVFGDTPAEIQVQEGAMKLLVDVVAGQKTGFFIDQREMRKFVSEISNNKRVLNCFSYSGGFSVAALFGGAIRVVSVDSSEAAIALCSKNIELNNFDSSLHEGKCVNAFDYLGGTHERFDLVILDPPAFAKQRDHLRNAMKAYRQINLTGMKLIKPGGLLITSSCSNFVSEQDFEREILQVAVESGRRVSVVGRHRQAVDHPIRVKHEQGAYLKSLILLVN